MIINIFRYTVAFLLICILKLNLYSITVSVMPFRVPGNDDEITNYNAIDGLARVFTDELARTRRLYTTDYDLFVAYASDVDNYHSYNITSTNKLLAVNYATNFFKTDYVLFGELFEVSLSTNQKDNIDKVFISVRAELVDVNTMNVITNVSASTNYSMPTNRYSSIYKMDDAYFYESVLGRATVEVASNISSSIVASLFYPPTHGVVTRVETNNSFYINLGKNNELLIDDVFEIYDIARIYTGPTNVADTNNLTNQNDNVVVDIGGGVVVEDITGDPYENNSQNNNNENTKDSNSNNVTLFVKDEKDNNGEIESADENEKKENEDTLNSDENKTDYDTEDRASEVLGKENETLDTENLEYADSGKAEEDNKDTIFRSNNSKDTIKKWNYINRFGKKYEDVEADTKWSGTYVVLKNKAGKMSYIETKLDPNSLLGTIKKDLLPANFFSVYRPIATNDIGEQFYLSEMLFKYKHFEEETTFVGYARVIDLYDNFAILEIVNLSREEFERIKAKNIANRLLNSDTNLINISPSKTTFKTKSGKTDYVQYSRFLEEEKLKKQNENTDKNSITQPVREEDIKPTESDLIENNMIEEAIKKEEEERLRAIEQERLERERIEQEAAGKEENIDNNISEISDIDNIEGYDEEKQSTETDYNNTQHQADSDVLVPDNNSTNEATDGNNAEVLAPDNIKNDSETTENTAKTDETSNPNEDTNYANNQVDIYPNEYAPVATDDNNNELLITDESGITDNTTTENTDSKEEVAENTETTTTEEDKSGYQTPQEEINIKPLMRVILIRDK